MTRMEIKERVQGRIFIRGKLENTSPLAVSDGATEFSDADIYRDIHGKPMIPGTSFMGALKSLLESHFPDECTTAIYRYLFGHQTKEGKEDVQSHLIIDDLTCISDDIITNVRDGVRINPKTNLAEDQGKYDYEILEPGHKFKFEAEITIREGVDVDEVDKWVSVLRTVLETEGVFQVGALTSFGFGQMSVHEMKKTNLLKGQDYLDFLKNHLEDKWWSNVEKSDTRFDRNVAVFEMTLRPVTPLFIGGGKLNTAADDASLQSKNDYILSAKSLKGAVRHHAYRIAHTVHDREMAEALCNDIFGYRDQKEQTKSRFWTSDAVVENPGGRKLQMQVAIDRFTGGAMESTLFATEPAWPEKDTSVRITWHLRSISSNVDKAAIGLLLLVARDLMTEMLPIGGDKSIGRGRFAKKSYTFTLEGVKYTLDSSTEKFNEYINAFIRYKKTQNDDN